MPLVALAAKLRRFLPHDVLKHLDSGNQAELLEAAVKPLERRLQSRPFLRSLREIQGYRCKALCETGELEEGLKYFEQAVAARRKVLNFLDINAIGGDLSTAYMGSAQVDSNILFSQYLLEMIRPMIEIVKCKLELKGKGAPGLSNYDCRKDIKQFIHIVSEIVTIINRTL